jgi:hypothetical protein
MDALFLVVCVVYPINSDRHRNNEQAVNLHEFSILDVALNWGSV